MLLDGSHRETPFDEICGFEHAWWHRRVLFEGTKWFALRAESSVDLVRVEVALDKKVGSLYSGVEIPQAGFMQISLLEVRQDKRGEGYGREAVRQLLTLYPERRFAAFSEADEFWTAIGWTRFMHDSEPRAQFLFISPSP